MHLVLIRHAHAAPAAPGGAEADRPLTREGEAAAGRTAASLAALALPPSRVVSSPKLRAMQTARIVADRLGAPPPRALACLAGGQSPEAILAGLAAEAADCVIAVGHMPDLGTLVASLIEKGAEPGAASFAPGSYVWIEMDATRAKRRATLRSAGGP